MCRFKSGIILKNKVVLTPIFNDSHSTLLESMGIKDDRIGMTKIFVRAELIPPNNNVFASINKWKFIVDQDVVPEWFENDRGKYEEEMRTAVADFVKNNFAEILGYAWSPIDLGNGCTRYVLFGSLNRSEFGKTNNYKESTVRQDLNNSELCKRLKEMHGDRLVPITLSLTTMDGLHDYGTVEGDYLSLLNLDIYRECGEYIPCLDIPWWLATGESTDRRYGSDYVRYVRSNGNVGCCDCGWDDKGVRPFFIARER